VNYQLKLLFEFLAYFCPFNTLRVLLHKFRGLSVGEDVYLGRELLIDRVYASKISIGDHTSIGDRTIIAAHASTPNNVKNKEYFETVKPVKIGSNVWIMPQVIIGPGVTIGHNCVIVTGSVVLKDVAPGSIVRPPKPEILHIPKTMN